LGGVFVFGVGLWGFLVCGCGFWVTVVSGGVLKGCALPERVGLKRGRTPSEKADKPRKPGLAEWKARLWPQLGWNGIDKH